MNRFAAVNAVRKRAAQLFDGAPPTVEDAQFDYPVRTAFAELAAGTLRERTRAAEVEASPEERAPDEAAEPAVEGF